MGGIMAESKNCPQCGAQYEVTYYGLPEKDDDSFKCTCGETLAQWRSTAVPEFHLIKPGTNNA